MNKLFLWFFASFLVDPAVAGDEGVKFSMRNLCGEEVRVYWISFDGRSLVPQTTLPVKNSSSVSINSFRSHRFLVWYSKGRTEEQVQAEAWEKGEKYTVGDTNDIVTIEPGLVFVRHDAQQLALEAAEEAVRACDTRGADNTTQTLDPECLTNYVTDWLANRRGELDFEWTVYRNLKAGLEKYNCASSLPALGGPGTGNSNAKAANSLASASVEAAAAKKAKRVSAAKAKAKVTEKAAASADEDPRCREWAFVHNQCAENPNYMLRSCAANCAAFRDKEAALAMAAESKDGDSGDNTCVNLDAVVDEGENELGHLLRGRGDVATKRSAPGTVVAAALPPCLTALKQAQAESLAAGPESLIAEAEAEAAAVGAPAPSPDEDGSGGGLLSWFRGGSKRSGEDADDASSPVSGVVLSGQSGNVGLGAEATHRRHLPALLPQGHALAKCLAEHGLGRDFASVSREVSRVRNAKGKLAEPLRNQTCGDDDVGTIGVPEDTVEFEWVAPVSDDYVGEYDDATGTTGKTPSAGMTAAVTAQDGADAAATAAGQVVAVQPVRGGSARRVTQLLNRNNAQVFVIDNFVSEEECNTMIDAATPGLRRSTVNEEGNNQAVSQYRNSQAANVMANWRNKSDPIARVVRRSFAFANDHTGYGLTVDGQEPFSVIQYLGGQEYRPHCDGSCDGSPHLHAGRVATMLMYCRVADSGGGTSFTKAGIHVKPEQGQAVFFSYRGENNTMDVELTEHSGCPVKFGTKWVVTQWLRSGVGKGESWTKFDPIGGRL